MKVALVVTGVEDRASGVSVFVCNLADELKALGHDCVVVTRASRDVDYSLFEVVHINALWSPWLHRQCMLARRAGAKIVWTTHGMLTKWAMRNHWWKKVPAWWLYQKNDLKYADLIHVTANAEIDDVRRVGLTNAVVVAPLGVHVEDYLVMDDKLPSMRRRTLSFVGRVHRIKGLERLVRAFANVLKVHPEGPGWKLDITGPDEEGHTGELRNLVGELGLADVVFFRGPCFGAELRKTYACADCLVLPSFSENFGSVVIESLASGVPVVATKGTPWGDLEAQGCGWWAENSEAGIETALRSAMALSDEERRAMGARGRRLVLEKYSWSAVGRKLAAAYRGNGESV